MKINRSTKTGRQVPVYLGSVGDCGLPGCLSFKETNFIRHRGQFFIHFSFLTNINKLFHKAISDIASSGIFLFISPHILFTFYVLSSFHCPLWLLPLKEPLYNVCRVLVYTKCKAAIYFSLPSSVIKTIYQCFFFFLKEHLNYFLIIELE